jgi:hypothetical protein
VVWQGGLLITTPYLTASWSPKKIKFDDSVAENLASVDVFNPLYTRVMLSEFHHTMRRACGTVEEGK